MRLGNAVFRGRVARISLFRDELSLASHAALQLRLDFATSSLFEWVGAADCEDCTSDRE
jgi:hypothetical protein